jgi:predicted phosphodiesterase
MGDILLLRFRDLVADTISEHNALVERFGNVLWGWWKKPLEPMPDPGLQLIQREIRETPGAIHYALFINSANKTLYRAQLFQVFYQPGGEETAIPPELAERCPEYYRSRKLPAWFLIGKIEGISGIEGRPVPAEEAVAEDISHLARYVWSRQNRTVPKQQSLTALPKAAIEQGVLDFDFLDSNVSLWFLTPESERGLPNRSDVVLSLSKSIWTAKGRYALHLSDLHFGTSHGFRNQLVQRHRRRVSRESLLEVLLEDLRASQLIGSGPDANKIALVLVTGDLTCSGDAHEFANAESFLRELCNELGLHISQVVVVPGNHDIEWRDEKGNVDENADYNYFQFTKNLYACESDESFLRIHRFIISGRPVTLIGLNSCVLETKENAGLGYVGRGQLMRALRFLNELEPEPNSSKNDLRIALIHHHLLPVNFVEDIDWETKRISMTLDADGVLRYLMFANVRIVLHGHQHQPFSADIRRILHGFIDPFRGMEHLLNQNIAVIGGGSIGVERRHLNVVGRNAYNIIDLGRNNDVEIRTRLQSSVGPGFSAYFDPVYISRNP